MADASLGTAVLRTRLDASGLQAGLNQAESQTRAATQSMSQQLTRLGGQFTRVGTALTVGITAPLTALAGIGIRSAMQLETFSASLRVIIGDADRANAVFERLYEFSANVPFDWRTLSEGTRVLAAFGTEAEDIVPTLSMIGDVASGTGSDLVGLAEIYGRVMVTGRLSMQEVNSLALRGVPIYTELAKVVGVSTEEVRGLISTGSIGFPQLQQVLKNLTDEGGQFFGMMEAQAQTTEGRLNTLKDSFEQVTDAIGRRLLPEFDKLIAVGQRATDWFNQLSDSSQETLITFGGILASIGPLTLAFGGLLTVIGKIPAALAAVRAGLAVLAGPAGLIALAASAAVGLGLALAFRGDSLESATKAASQALASSDTDSLVSGLDRVASQLDENSPVRANLQALRADLVQTGEVGKQMAEDIRQALLEATVAPLRAELATLQAQAEQIDRLIDAERTPNVAAQRLAELRAEGERILDQGREIPWAMWSEMQQLEASLEGLGASTAELARQEGRLSDNRARQSQLLDQINGILSAAGTSSSSAPAPAITVPGGSGGGSVLGAAVQRTVELVFAELEAVGTQSLREATRLIENGADEEATRVADLRTRIRALENARTELLRDFYDEVTDAQLEYLTRRIAEARADLQSVLNPPQEGRFIPGAVEPGNSIPDSILGPVMLPFRDMPEGIIPALVGQMDPAAIQAARDSLRDYQATLEELGRVGRETATAQRELAAVIADPFGTAIRDAMREQGARREVQAPIGRSGATGPTDEQNFIRGLMAEYEAADQAAADARRSLNNYNLSLEELSRRGREAAVAQREAAQAQAELTAALRAQKEALRELPYDPFADWSDPRSQNAPSRFSDDSSDRMAAYRRAADEQAKAIQTFAETVASAGFRFTDNLIDAIRSGDIGSAFKAVLGAGQSILGSMNLGGLSFLGGSIGIAGLISGVLGVLGSLIGGGRSSDEQRRREMAQQSRTVPAVNINFTMNQTNHIEAMLADGTVEAMLRRVSVNAFEDFFARSGIEQRLAKLGV